MKVGSADGEECWRCGSEENVRWLAHSLQEPVEERKPMCIECDREVSR